MRLSCFQPPLGQLPDLGARIADKYSMAEALDKFNEPSAVVSDCCSADYFTGDGSIETADHYPARDLVPRDISHCRLSRSSKRAVDARESQLHN